MIAVRPVKLCRTVTVDCVAHDPLARQVTEQRGSQALRATKVSKRPITSEAADQSCARRSSIAAAGLPSPRSNSHGGSVLIITVNQIIIYPCAALKCREIERQIAEGLPMHS
jgi:hypothetical protein